jgi:hypothetical protein
MKLTHLGCMNLQLHMTFTQFFHLLALFSVKNPQTGLRSEKIGPPSPNNPDFPQPRGSPGGKCYSWNVCEWVWKMYEFLQKPGFYITHLYRGFPGSCHNRCWELLIQVPTVCTHMQAKNWDKAMWKSVSNVTRWYIVGSQT